MLPVCILKVVNMLKNPVFIQSLLMERMLACVLPSFYFKMLANAATGVGLLEGDPSPPAGTVSVML